MHFPLSFSWYFPLCTQNIRSILIVTGQASCYNEKDHSERGCSVGAGPGPPRAGGGNRSQSSLSKSIRRLEEELGISIFERTTRRVELTPAGRDFVTYAEQMMVCYEGMLHAMEQHRSNGKRSLRVGSIYFGLHNRLAPLVANFSKLHPSMEIAIRESTTTPLLQDLHKGELDVVFVSSMYPEGAERANFSQYPEYRSHSCFRESYQIGVSRDHPFAGRSQLTYEDLADQPFIMTDRTMDVYHRAVQKAFDAHRVPLHIAMYCTTVRSVLHMVSQNMGIAMLSPLVIEESDDLCIIPLKDALLRDTQMVILNQKEIPPHVRSFYHYVKTQNLA